MSSTAAIVSFSLLLFTSAAVAVAVAEPLTVYQVLEQYDLPAGLLPTGVTSYTLNNSTGEFVVNIGKTCSFTVQGYELKYKSTVSGVIRKDKLRKLKGVSVKLLFFWLDIVKVKRDVDELEFSVGIMSADFEIEGFEESPECGCGFDCNGLESGGGKKRVKMVKNGGFGEVDDVFSY